MRAGVRITYAFVYQRQHIPFVGKNWMLVQEKDKLDLFYVANHRMLKRVTRRKQLHVVIQELTILPEHLIMSAFPFFMIRVAHL